MAAYKHQDLKKAHNGKMAEIVIISSAVHLGGKDFEREVIMSSKSMDFQRSSLYLDDAEKQLIITNIPRSYQRSPRCSDEVRELILPLKAAANQRATSYLIHAYDKRKLVRQSKATHHHMLTLLLDHNDAGKSGSISPTHSAQYKIQDTRIFTVII